MTRRTAALFRVRPLSDRTWLRPPDTRRRSLFVASYADTRDLLRAELEHLDAQHVVLEVDVAERWIRSDGELRSDANPSDPAVVLAFESRHGPLMYRSDVYGEPSWKRRGWPAWQDNLRAVALALEALRAVDRYGVSGRGEQYTGWKALPPGTGAAPTGMTTDLAIEILDRESGWTAAGDVLLDAHLGDALRRARKNTSPDRNGGDRSRWDAVDAAEQTLRRAGRLT